MMVPSISLVYLDKYNKAGIPFKKVEDNIVCSVRKKEIFVLLYGFYDSTL